MMRRLKGIEILILWHAGKTGIRNNPDSSTATRLIDKGYLDEDPDDPDRLIITPRGQHIYQTVMEGNVAHELTEIQLSVLAAGMNQTEFVLTHPQRGSRPQRLVDMGLIERANKGKYRITALGITTYQETMTNSVIPEGITESVTTRIKSGDAEYSDAIYQTLADMHVTVEDIESIKAAMDHDGSVARSIARYVETLRTQAYEQRQEIDRLTPFENQIEQQYSQIEALRRCITDLENKLINIQPTRADVFLAGQILDELCELIPEVEAYRVARESAVKAISILKAKR